MATSDPVTLFAAGVENFFRRRNGGPILPAMRVTLQGLGTAIGCILILTIGGQARGQSPGDGAIHLGVASCAGSNCHGSAERNQGSSVAQNEFLIWSKSDKHHSAYTVLLEERAVQIARNLGLANAATADVCLGCHTDFVPPARRGPLFQISDGVGCEACHGGSSTWLGIHISGARHSENLAAGLYPTEQPVARAAKCLSCHFGDPADDNRFVTHRIMGAGHPRMGFELDTYTAVEPAHFVVDQSYIERKGPVDDVRVWAVGQAVDLVKRMDALIEPKRAPRGLFPELVLFDCQSCHHPYNSQPGEGYGSTASAPGSLKLYDANAVMLQAIAAHLAPATDKTLSSLIPALQNAIGESWSAVQGNAREMRRLANRLLPTLASRDFSRDDAKALTRNVISLGLAGDGTKYSVAEQATMALASIASALRSSGQLSDGQASAMTQAMNRLYGSFAADETYHWVPFVKALKEFQRTVPR
jgi:Cytochrome c554 and c-prime